MHPNHLQKILDEFLGIPLCVLLGGSRFRSPEREHSRNGISSPKRILLIQLSALGDTILAIPTIRAIRHSFPDAHIAILASSRTLQYLEHCPYIDQRIRCHLQDLLKSPRRLAQFFRNLRRQQFDWAIDFEHWPRLTALIAYGSGAPKRVGFCAAGQHRHYSFTDVVEHVPGRHEVINFLDIAKILGCQNKGTYLEVWQGEENRKWASDFLQKTGVEQDRPIVVFHPEAGRRGEPRRRWPIERFVQIADALATCYQAQIILTGTPSEAGVSRQIATEARCRCIIAAGKTDINQLASLFAAADLMICGNCGPMHLAAATATPLIALNGPTNPSQWGPWSANQTLINADLPCSPCLNLGSKYGCPMLSDGTSPCMHTIQIRNVLKACEQYLA